MKLTKNIFFILTALLFSIQITLQSIPIAHTIIVNGEAMCTCGCGHTVAMCEANHGDGHSNCKCQHDKDESVRYVFAKNVIHDIVITKKLDIFPVDTYYTTNFDIQQIFDQYVVEISTPPPNQSFV